MTGITPQALGQVAPLATTRSEAGPASRSIRGRRYLAQMRGAGQEEHGVQMHAPAGPSNRSITRCPS